jgi:hypothetical protein
LQSQRHSFSWQLAHRFEKIVSVTFLSGDMRATSVMNIGRDVIELNSTCDKESWALRISSARRKKVGECSGASGDDYESDTGSITASSARVRCLDPWHASLAIKWW